MEIIAIPVAENVAEKVAENLVAQIERHLGYLFNYRSNILDLTLQIQNLRYRRERVQQSVDEANRQGDEIFPDVEKWLSRAEEIIKEIEKFVEDEREANRGCFNLKLRYQRSKKAKNQAGDIVIKIQEADKFGMVSHRPPPPVIGSSSLSSSHVFKSRETTLNQIMEALTDDNIRMVGIWGMGGVGKTTLVQQVAQRAQVAKQASEEKLFDAVVMALNISQTPNVTKIQGQIASMLGLEFKERESESERALRLSQSLKKHKKILVVLDDIWEPIEFQTIGIPYGSDDHKVGYCKVLLSSREHHVLSKGMSTHKEFHVQHLCEEEAWSLFKKTAGDSVEKPELKPIATEVVKECEGLPVAIATIAKALKGESVAVWKNALEELRRSAPKNITGVSTNVYSCLELSYNHLESDEVKSLFLLCGLLGDGDISLDDLLKYGMGLDLFDYIDSLEQARNKLVTLVKILKASSLLLDVEDGHYSEAASLFFVEEGNKFVRMHDVVRDVAKAIASKDPHRFVVKEAFGLQGWQGWQKRVHELGKCTRMSLNCRDIDELPEGLVCPKLEFFLLNSNDNSLKIPDTFFKEMKEVRVLSLFRIDLTQLPSSLHFLSNLQTLCLYGCETLEGIAILGELKKLQILSLVDCGILEFPKEMMQLTDLRMLSLRGCLDLRVVPRNVISSLTRLEHLDMGSFDGWESEGVDGEGKNACLSELKHLSCLRGLKVVIPDLYLLPEDGYFENLTRYDILIGIPMCSVYGQKTSRRLCLSQVKGPHLVKCIFKLLKTTEYLNSSGLDDTKHFAYELDSDGFLQLKYLYIYSSDAMQYIMNTMETEWVNPPHSAFPLLEELRLAGLPSLEAVCQGPIPMGCFANLRVLTIHYCYSLKYILWLPTAQGRESVLEFPQLRLLELDRLPDLTGFYSRGTSGIQEQCIPFFNEQVALPRLESLHLSVLENVRTVWDKQHLAGSSNKLVDLHVEDCTNLLTVFPSNFLEGLGSLQILKINNCCSLKGIFEMGEINSVEISGIGVSPLKEMASYGPNMKSVRKKDPQGYLAFQNLSSLKVGRCASLKYLFPASVVRGLVQLEALEISNCGVEEIVANENGVDAVPMFLFPRLTSLALNDLGQLKSFYREKYTLECPLLKKLAVWNCDKVELLFQKKSLQGEVDKQPLFLVQKNTFPIVEELQLNLKVTLLGLESLHLDSMENVRTMWEHHDPVGSSSKLKGLYLKGCQNMLTVFPCNCLEGFQSLQTVEIEDCRSLKEIFEAGEINRAEYDGIGVPSLKEMSLHNQNMKSVRKKDPQGHLAFQNLNSLKVGYCASLKYLFPASVVKGLAQLEVLEISDCGVEEIVANESGLEEVPIFLFPSLTSLKLSRLYQLKRFYGGDYTLRCPLLKKLEVCKCDEVELLLQEKSLQDEIDEQPLFLVEKNTFPNLEELKLGFKGPMEVWWGQFSRELFGKLRVLEIEECHDISVVIPSGKLQVLHNLKQLIVRSCNSVKKVIQVESHVGEALPRLTIMHLEDLPMLMHLSGLGRILQNLHSLQVSKCGNLINLVSPSMAKTLVQLEELVVSHCELNEIVENEGGEAMDNEIVFTKLQHLRLHNLPNLKCFCSARYTFKFPCLTKVAVIECPEMEIFCKGALTTSRSMAIFMDEDEPSGEDDLNSIIQKEFIAAHPEEKDSKEEVPDEEYAKEGNSEEQHLKVEDSMKEDTKEEDSEGGKSGSLG